MMRSVIAPRAAWRGVLSAALVAIYAATPLPAWSADTPAKGAAKPAATSRGKAPAPAEAAPPAPPPEQFADGIAAVVNKDVITLREVRDATQAAMGDLTRQKIQLPPQDVLQRQVLQRLIMQRLQRQEAARMNIKVDQSTVDQAINTVAARNKISMDQLRKEVEKSGISWETYRRNIADEVLSDRLRARTVDANIIISDAEVDAYLKEQQRRRGGAPASAPMQQAEAPEQQAAAVQSDRIALAQILVRVPDGSNTEQVAVLRKKAEDLLARVKGGSDFASVAAASSDGPEALQGGAMGVRPLDGWPDLFVRAVANLPKGQVSGIIQSGNGFHILKVLDRASGGAPAPAPAPQAMPQQPPGGGAPQGPMQVTQTHARHILIKTSAVVNDAQARQRLELLRQRIVSGGEDFATLARQNSQDATAPQGGDLGWLSPGETVPPFEAAMNTLKINEISEPIQSPFGWHLIQVLERREKDVADEMQRMQARRTLFERRSEPAFEDWLDQLHDQAYIDNRLEKQEQRDKANR
ncbi:MULTISPECIES: peptidylprolyl isomerase [unclassified Achromobacter]|uniref:peptidylprolyl isomerase n=1 Tax=unclassified Achromobacter TaxID=2626865 RepID=UPI000B5154EB|nr:MULTISPECIES: peptidylprolyl isomerase [unclassified Achromobacter]OWT71593.1 molecular chaperone SurA [Achromobacter sp. HZ34]OWT73250.1 molecular chaperone SurA [Achromobacter sp. HZ28]